MAFLVLVAAAAVMVYRAKTPEERIRFAGAAVRVLQRLKQVLTLRHRQLDAFHDARVARTHVAPVTPVLIAANITVFVWMLFTSGSPGDPNTLIGWGANFGPRTTNGEWWRLATALFVHAGWLQLLINLVSLAQLGIVLERLVGPLAFASVYFAAGVFTGVAHLWASPVTVSVGASGAIFGAYALLLASWMWGLLPRVPATIPAAVARAVAPAAAVFILYSLTTDAVASGAELGGFAAVFAGGLLVARGISDRTASVRRTATATAIVVTVALVLGVPLRGMTDVTPELERVATIEEHTGTAFRAAVDRFKNGTITAQRLAEVIDGEILPELTAARARVESLEKIPPQQRTLLAACKEYLRLRDESWRVRAAALRRGSMPMLSEADTIERASLEKFREITADAPQS